LIIRTTRRNTVTFALWVLLIGWMALIFFFSSQDASSSSASSGTAIRTVAAAVSPSYRQMPPPKQDQVVTAYQNLARKSAHALLYLVLGVLSAAAISRHIGKTLPLIVIAELVSILYACSDELHQHFSAGRSPQITDVLLDSAGALCGILLLVLFARGRRYLKNRRAKKRLASAESAEK